jgi:hypothetical protein
MTIRKYVRKLLKSSITIPPVRIVKNQGGLSFAACTIKFVNSFVVLARPAFAICCILFPGRG